MYSKMKKTRLVAEILLLVSIALYYALDIGLYSTSDLFKEIFLGVIAIDITVLITAILLRGQTEEQRNAELSKNIEERVYEEKLRLYQSFLQYLCDILQANEIDYQKRLKLIFETASIGIHTKLENISDISKGIDSLINAFYSYDNSVEKKTKEEKILESLFHIVDCFRRELYEFHVKRRGGINSPTNEQRLEMENIKSLFSSAFEVIPEERKSSTCSLHIATVPPEHPVWEGYLSDWKKRSWEISDNPCEDVEFTLQRKDFPGRFEIGLRKGHYYIQASYDDDVVFARTMKWKYNGSRFDKTWWKHFDEPFYNIRRGTFRNELSQNKEFQKYLATQIQAIMKHMETQKETLTWKKEIEEVIQSEYPKLQGKYRNFVLFTWYWKVLACEFFNESEGMPFLDIYRETNSDYVIIELYNRRNSEELIKETLDRIGEIRKLHVRTINNRIQLDKLEVRLEDKDHTAILVKKIVEYISLIATKTNHRQCTWFNLKNRIVKLFKF